jgi:hypothetical protein
VKSFARSPSAQKGPVAGVPKNSNRAAEVSYLAAEFAGENSCGVGVILTPRLQEMQVLFDSENPQRSGSLAGESYASVMENHPRYPSLRRVRDAKLLARLDRAVEQKIKCVWLLQRFGFDESGIALYHAAALSAFRAALPIN